MRGGGIGCAGGTGIGQAIALAFAAEGCRVVVTGRRLEPLHKTVAVALMSGLPGSIQPIQSDIALPDQSGLVGQVVDWGGQGRLDILVNNAGNTAFRGATADNLPLPPPSCKNTCQRMYVRGGGQQIDRAAMQMGQNTHRAEHPGPIFGRYVGRGLDQDRRRDPSPPAAAPPGAFMCGIVGPIGGEGRGGGGVGLTKVMAVMGP